MTRIGKLELRVPRDREGRFSTELFDRYQRSEKALVSALAEMYVHGVSTRKVKAVTEELCGHTFSASTISRINKSLDGLLRRFAQRRRDEAYPYLNPRCALRKGPPRRGDPVAEGTEERTAPRRLADHNLSHESEIAQLDVHNLDELTASQIEHFGRIVRRIN